MRKSGVISILLVVIMLVTFFTNDLNVQGLSELEKTQNEKKSLENQLKDIEAQIKKEEQKLKSNQSEKERLQSKAKIEQAEKEKLAAQLLILYKEIESLDESIKEAENTYETKEEEFFEKARLIYVYSKKSPLQVIAESSSIVDFYRRVNMLLLISKLDKELLNDLIEQKEEIEYKKSLKNESAEKVDKLITEKELIVKEINLTKKELEAAISATSKKINTLEGEEEALKKEQEEIQKKLKELEEKRKKEGTQTKYVGGVMLWPVPSSSRISSGYGKRKSPITGRSEFHSGIDIPAPKGNSILAAADGEVILAERKGGYGNCVIIDHGGGITTLYGHASALLVKEGQKVKKGAVIAKIGSTGWSTGNHLHFQVMKNGSHTDPMPYLTKK